MLSLFVPAYDEEEVLECSVNGILKAVDGFCCELFIVDDGSADQTPEIGQKLAQEHENVEYLRYDDGPTRRENLAKSFGRACGDVVGFIDADLSVGPEHISDMMQHIGEYDIVVGSRLCPGADSKRKMWRGTFSNLGSWFVRSYFGSNVRDHQCGLKLFKQDVLEALVDAAGFDETGGRGFFWDTEVLVRAQRMGYKVMEYPVRWRESGDSSVQVRRDWRMLPYMLKLKGRL